jgi:hypothetical protein
MPASLRYINQRTHGRELSTRLRPRPPEAGEDFDEPENSYASANGIAVDAYVGPLFRLGETDGRPGEPAYVGAELDEICLDLLCRAAACGHRQIPGRQRPSCPISSRDQTVSEYPYRLARANGRKGAGTAPFLCFSQRHFC